MWTHPSAGLVVVEVHEGSGLVWRASFIIPLFLFDIDESLSKSVSVVDVVPTTAPDVVSVKEGGGGWERR